MERNEQYQELINEWTAAGQGHIFKFWNELDEKQKDDLYRQAKSIDVKMVTDVYRKLSQQGEEMKKKPADIKPLPHVVSQSSFSAVEQEDLLRIGLDEIRAGRVAVLLLAGGQGTRLGCTDPKGMYDVGLQSHKSLFQLQAERLQLVERLASDQVSENHTTAPRSPVRIPWYIMTSFVTDTTTQQFFADKHYFGLDPDQIFFFNQSLFPCMREEDGRILMISKHEIAVAPNGNGGLWSALHSTGALADMERRGIQYVASYGVDNILAKVADPLFIGFTKRSGCPISCKVVSKASPDERVGVLCLKDEKPAVIEYSEIHPDQAKAVDPYTGTLVFNAAHIVLNNFTVPFIKSVVDPQSNKLALLPYHVAKKRIPCIDDEGQFTEIMGWKFELFVFDVFEFADQLSAIEVVRAHEFSPLKNSTDYPSDNPITCRQHLSQLHQKWVTDAGGIIIKNSVQQQTGGEEPLFEISSTVSYAGEGLKPHVDGRTFILPYYLHAGNLRE